MDAARMGKDRPYYASLYAMNGDTAAIPVGALVCLDPTTPGAVKLAGNVGSQANAISLFLGVAPRGAALGDPVQVVTTGYVKQATYLIRSRAASTDTWSTVQTQAAGIICAPFTANNCLQSTAAAAASNYIPAAILAESRSTIAGQASTYLGTALSEFGPASVFLRAL